MAQIPWATAQASRSRQEAQEEYATQLSLAEDPGNVPAPTETREEALLAAILAANQELSDVFRVYNDLLQMGKEREMDADQVLQTICSDLFSFSGFREAWMNVFQQSAFTFYALPAWPPLSRYVLVHKS